VKPRAYTGPTAARLLDDLLARPEIAKRCKEVSRWFDGVDAREAACQAIEDLAHRLRVSA
jgi:hypothetical protein